MNRTAGRWCGCRSSASRCGRSLFYLNFLRVPPLRQTDSDEQTAAGGRNRLKVFYRPAGLAGDANHVIDKLSLHKVGNAASMQHRLLRQRQPGRDASGAKRTTRSAADLIRVSRANWPVNGEVRQITLRVINDYGVEIRA